MLDFTKCDGYLLTNKENKRYMTGFRGSESIGIITGTNKYLITDGRYAAIAPTQLYDDVEGIITTTGQSHFACAVELLEKLNLNVLGVEGTMETKMYLDLKQALPGTQIEVTTNVIEKLREVKTPEELDAIRAAVKITDLAFSEIVKNIKVGMTELEVKNLVDNAHVKFGGDKPSFDTIVASGLNGAYPHAVPSSKVLEDGDMVTIDFGTFKNGYCSDMTRSFFVGNDKNPKLVEIHNVVREAHVAQVKAARPGISGHELDKIGRDIIIAAGYGDYFIHGTGHSFGLEVHENPRAAIGWEQKFVVGNVVTIEPGIYVEGIGGVRIENDIIITESGCENLNQSALDYDIALKG